jgi:uncharacterized protein YndB with AHSA1/START domain
MEKTRAPQKGRTGVAGKLHLEKVIASPVERCFSAFRFQRDLARWYDPSAVVAGFGPGGTVKASYFPSYEIVAVVKNQLVAQRYTAVIDGIGMFSFIEEGKKTRVVLDHVAEGNSGVEIPARTFHWQGLLENLAALCEHRPISFINGAYSKPFPKGIRHATCEEFIRAWGK